MCVRWRMEFKYVVSQLGTVRIKGVGFELQV
jgi:hypothetical protein